MKTLFVLMILATSQAHASWGKCEDQTYRDYREPAACATLITLQVVFPPLFTGFALSNFTKADIFKADAFQAELEKYEATGAVSPELKSMMETIKFSYEQEKNEISEEEILSKLETAFLQ
jgi:hypothetical protein